MKKKNMNKIYDIYLINKESRKNDVSFKTEFERNLFLNKKANKIYDYEKDEKIVLLDSFTDNEGNKISKVEINVDFVIYHHGKTEIIKIFNSNTNTVLNLKWKFLKKKFAESCYILTKIELYD